MSCHIIYISYVLLSKPLIVRHFGLTSHSVQNIFVKAFQILFCHLSCQLPANNYHGCVDAALLQAQCNLKQCYLFLFNYCSVIENKHSYSGFFSSNSFWLCIQYWCLLMENRTLSTFILAFISDPIKTDLPQTLPGATLQLRREIIIISSICSQKLLSSSSQAVLKQEFTLRLCIN